MVTWNFMYTIVYGDEPSPTFEIDIHCDGQSPTNLHGELVDLRLAEDERLIDRRTIQRVRSFAWDGPDLIDFTETDVLEATPDVRAVINITFGPLVDYYPLDHLICHLGTVDRTSKFNER